MDKIKSDPFSSLDDTLKNLDGRRKLMYILDRYPDAKQSFYSRINNAEEAGRNEQKQLQAQMAQAPASQAPDLLDLIKYKRELKGQFKEKLDEIELECRDWLRAHTTAFTEDELSGLFSVIDEARKFEGGLSNARKTAADPAAETLLENAVVEQEAQANISLGARVVDWVRTQQQQQRGVNSLPIPRSPKTAIAAMPPNVERSPSDIDVKQRQHPVMPRYRRSEAAKATGRGYHIEILVEEDDDCMEVSAREFAASKRKRDQQGTTLPSSKVAKR